MRHLLIAVCLLCACSGSHTPAAVEDAGVMPSDAMGCTADTSAEELQLGSGLDVGSERAMEARDRSFRWTAPADGLYFVHVGYCAIGSGVTVFDLCTGEEAASSVVTEFQDVPSTSVSLDVRGGDTWGIRVSDCDGVSVVMRTLDVETGCNDGLDDDHDGRTDCADLDCLNDSACELDDCVAADLGSDLGEPLALGDTRGRANERAPSCGGDGPDIALRWTAPATGRYRVHGRGSTFNHRLTVSNGTCGGEELGCAPRGFAEPDYLVLDLNAGQPVVIVFDGPGQGTFALNIVAEPE